MTPRRVLFAFVLAIVVGLATGPVVGGGRVAQQQSSYAAAASRTLLAYNYDVSLSTPAAGIYQPGSVPAAGGFAGPTRAIVESKTRTTTASVAAEGGEGVVTMPARSTNFTQNSIKATFSDGRSVFDQGLNPATAPPMRVFEEDGQLYSLDTRRLLVGQLQDANVPVRYTTPAEYNAAVDAGRFTSTNGGIGITVRGGFGFFQFPSMDLAEVG